MGYKEQTYELLKDFKQGLIDDETFLKKLRSSEYTDLGFAMIDHERSLLPKLFTVKEKRQSRRRQL